jgi:tRNA modification GTPase
VTGQGLDAVADAIAERAGPAAVPELDVEPIITRERHRVALQRAAEALQAAGGQLVGSGDPVLASHHVREATLALEELIGAVDVEDVLDRLFSSFCVGK